MRISIYIAISANGMISNARNVPDWLSPEYGKGFVSICQKTKAVIMGKTTYNILAPDNLPLQKKGTTVVLTTDERAKSDNPTVVFTKKKADKIAKMLEKKGHTEAVIIGGAMTMSEFLKAGLVNDMYLIMEPVLFGNGLALLKNIDLEAKLKLLDVKKMNQNTVQIHYGIINEANKIKKQMEDPAKSPAELVKSLFLAFQNREWEVVDNLLHPEFVFSSPPDPKLDKEQYFERCYPFSKKVKSFDFLKIMEKGNEVFAMYKCSSEGLPDFTNTEFFVVKGGKIKSVKVFFGNT